MATLKDVSRRAGVSVTTASRVLNRDATMSVSEKTSRAIFEAAIELNYLSPRMRHVAKDQTLRIGVVDWHVVLKGHPNIRLSSLQYLAEVMALSQPLEFVQLRRGVPDSVDGIIAFGDYERDDFDFMLTMTRRIVLVKTNRADFLFDQVEIEHEIGIQQALSYLAKKANGSVALISGVYHGDGYSIGTRRTETVQALMRDMDIYHPKHVWISKYSRKAGEQMAYALLAQDEQPQGLFITSDVVASGVLATYAKKAPASLADLHIVVYRDLDTVQLPQVPVSFILMYTDLVWQKAIQMLTEQINGRVESVKTIIPARFVPAENYRY